MDQERVTLNCFFLGFPWTQGTHEDRIPMKTEILIMRGVSWHRILSEYSPGNRNPHDTQDSHITGIDITYNGPKAHILQGFPQKKSQK